VSNFHQSDSEREFEARLSQEMKRVSAPDGFADRIMHRVEVEAEGHAAQKRRSRLTVMPRRSAWMAIAAMLLVGILIGGWQWRQQKIRHEREQAEQIQRQFDLAMQVTQRTLAEVQERIGHAGEIQVQKNEKQ
jgi:hypothetical protein